MTYNEWLLRLQAAAVTTDNDTVFLDYVPNFIDLAEQQCYRDLDLLSTVVRDTSADCTANDRNFTLPSALGRFVIVNGLNIVTPFGDTVATGTRTRLTQLSIDALDTLWPSNTAASATTVPQYFAMITDQTLAFGPPPGNDFQVEVVGTIRPTPLSSDNPTTYLTLYLPDLFFAASMVAVAGYQRNFGAQADDPKMAVSWDNEYKMRLSSANLEEQRKRFAGAGWTSVSPAPVAQQPR